MSESCSGNCSSCSSCAGCEKKPTALDNIKRCILVLSGKGGVGKSTVSASLAVTLAAQGRKVGLLDADFHGPSQPTLFGVNHLRLEGDENGNILPLELECGVNLVSVGLLIEDSDQAVVWRGPAKMAVLKQLIEETNWGELDDLILDFPPGTGDESLSACQLITGEKCAIVVTTPQEMSLADCRKCIDFCGKLDVPIAGIVENFAGFVCPDCGKRHELFASGGGKGLSEKYSLPLLAQLPIDPVFMAKCDAGNIATALKESTVGKEIENVAAVLR
ncbi:MAG: Mrp/NBP35 family ATP-binding protein [Lentisphaeria bacterium]|nr:Mrp/NBP35 family ATP-binding protein [Lentisphaeria bacterium]MBQ7396286.1 Mrp/NBP35 family ATP-binding protein [Lentisphaeria bacterium]MBR7120603.1 Mrp/NBP35 family ATP-binding protein [Lentisphaeria bacterium]